MKRIHLTLDNRVTIQTDLDLGKSFSGIAKDIEKDKTTVSKEIQKHVQCIKTGAYGRPFNNCKKRHNCEKYHICETCNSNKRCCFCGKCSSVCSEYSPEYCSKLKSPPYVCNGCTDKSKCTLEKMIYSAKDAQNEYEKTLVESRSGIAMDEEEIKSLNKVVSPLVQNGQSIHHICVNNSDLVMISERTVYKYIDQGLLTARNIDLRSKVRFRPRKCKSINFKVDKKCREGRTYEDFLKYRNDHPEMPLVQMDTVEGVKGGAVLLTLHFVDCKLQLSFFRERNDAKSVTETFHRLRETLGTETFKKLFPLILTDCGTEFSDPKSIEYDESENRICRVFYWEKSSPEEKGACERNHEFIRMYIPKGVDISKYTQKQIDQMMSHINSYARAGISDRCPYELFSFMFGDGILGKLNINKIAPNDIILRPSVLDSCD